GVCTVSATAWRHPGVWAGPLSPRAAPIIRSATCAGSDAARKLTVTTVATPVAVIALPTSLRCPVVDSQTEGYDEGVLRAEKVDDGRLASGRTGRRRRGARRECLP